MGTDIKDLLVGLWLTAEEELREGNCDSCLTLKDLFIEYYTLLNKEDQECVKGYLDSVAA
jgi:hypothetical protein